MGLEEQVSRQAKWERAVALATVVGQKAQKLIETKHHFTITDDELATIADCYATLLLEIALGMTTLVPNKHEQRTAELKVLGKSDIPPLEMLAQSDGLAQFGSHPHRE